MLSFGMVEMVSFPAEWHAEISPHRQAGSTVLLAAQLSLREFRALSRVRFLFVPAFFQQKIAAKLAWAFPISLSNPSRGKRKKSRNITVEQF